VGAGEVLIADEDSIETAGAEGGERNASETGPGIMGGPPNAGGVNHCSEVLMFSPKDGYTLDGISGEANASWLMCG
jgi:hypothetical protein